MLGGDAASATRLRHEIKRKPTAGALLSRCSLRRSAQRPRHSLDPHHHCRSHCKRRVGNSPGYQLHTSGAIRYRDHRSKQRLLCENRCKRTAGRYLVLLPLPPSGRKLHHRKNTHEPNRKRGPAALCRGFVLQSSGGLF